MEYHQKEPTCSCLLLDDQSPLWTNEYDVAQSHLHRDLSFETLQIRWKALLVLQLLQRCWILIDSRRLHPHFFLLCRPRKNISKMYMNLWQKSVRRKKNYDGHYQVSCPDFSKKVELACFLQIKCCIKIFLTINKTRKIWTMTRKRLIVMY